jgi:hypothetical protein
VIADCLEHQFSPHDHERLVVALIEALFEVVDNNPTKEIRPCEVQKILNCVKLKKACGIDGIPNECLRHLPRKLTVHLTHQFNHCLRLSHFPSSWKEVKVNALPKPGKNPKFSQNLRPVGKTI